MPTVEHSTLTTSDLHEPKGIANKAAGLVYISDGSGSGSWATPGAGIFSSAYFTGNVTATTISIANTYVILDPSTWLVSDSNGVTFSTNKFVAPNNGSYYLSLSLSFSGGGGGAGDIYSLCFAVNGTPIVPSPSLRRQTGSGDIGSGAVSTMQSLSSGDEVSIMIKNESSTNNPTVSDASFLIFELKED